MTVAQLISELRLYPSQWEVVVSDSPDSAFRLLGTFGRNDNEKVYLDPSTNEKDRVKGFLSED